MSHLYNVLYASDVRLSKIKMNIAFDALIPSLIVFQTKKSENDQTVNENVNPIFDLMQSTA